MAALAICAVTAALLRDRTDTQARPPVRPDQPPPASPGMIPLTVPEIRRLLAAADAGPRPRSHAEHWSDLRRRHQARACWHHNAPGSLVTPRSPWSASEWRLPYQVHAGAAIIRGWRGGDGYS
jgi:hypothetical protein